MSELMVSVSGVRGVVGRGMTPEAACTFAGALAAHLGGGVVLVGRDSRPSGAPLRHAVLAGLTAGGCSAREVNIVPTPSLGRAVVQLRAAGAVMVTASHNPPEWNGLKLFGPDGAVLSAADGEKVRQLYESGTPRRVDYKNTGLVDLPADAAGGHFDAVVALADVDGTRDRHFKVVLDGNGGAGGPLARRLLEALGCDVIGVGVEPDGDFRHNPEPTPESLAKLGPLVAGHEADFGVALDPDADRMALIDHTGRCLSEELTLALAVEARLAQDHGPVVINMSTSRAVEDLCKRAGVECHRSMVGERNVVDRMRELNALIGGEGGGGVIDPRVGWVRDPFAALALILPRLASQGLRLADAAAKLPQYTIVKRKLSVPREALPGLYERLRAKMPDATVNEIDGLRLDLADGWLHVRPSNTEPVVRVIAEAATEARAGELCEAVAVG